MQNCFATCLDAKYSGDKGNLLAIFANATYHHVSLLLNKAFWKLYFGYCNLLQAVGSTTDIAYKMYMVVMVMSCLAVVFAKGIKHTVISRWDGMYDAFFYKCL